MSYSASMRAPLDVVLDVLRLALHPFLPASSKLRRVERVYHLNTSRRKAEVSAYSYASDIASFNQGAIIEYIFMLAEKHKKLRISIESKDTDIQSDVDDLINFMNRGFFQSIYGNFRHLHRHFSGRSSAAPRIAVLGNWRTEDRDQIITIFRDRPVDYSNVFPLEESSALTHCARTGTHFLCNDIVFASLKQGYRNPRLSAKAAQKAYGRLNRDWRKFWESGNDDVSSSYKSTLVMPISIDRARLNSDMVCRFNAQDADRLIFGYLCLDHVDRDYFDEEIDVPISRMVSDIISIFSFQRLRFTDFSSTFSMAEDIIDGAENSLWIKDSVQKILESVSSSADSSIGANNAEEPARTVLMTADEVLLKAVEEETPVIEAVELR